MNLASVVMMGLGTFRFGVNRASYQNLKRVAEYRWTHLDRIGRDPAAQFLGPGVQTVTMDGVIYPHFRGGLRQVEGMRLAARAGQPMMLVDGLGFVLDQWVVTRVDEAKGVFMADGAPRRIAFTLTLQSYGDDAWPLSI